MESTLKIRHLTFNLVGAALAPIALSIYQALAELLSDHAAVRVIVDHGSDDDRAITRMVLTPADVELIVKGSRLGEVEPIQELMDGMKSAHAELGRVVVINIQDAVDALEASATGE